MTFFYVECNVKCGGGDYCGGDLANDVYYSPGLYQVAFVASMLNIVFLMTTPFDFNLTFNLI